MLTDDTQHTTKQKSKARPTIGLVEWFRVGEYERVKEVLADLRQLGVTELRTGISWADYYTPRAWSGTTG